MHTCLYALTRATNLCNRIGKQVICIAAAVFECIVPGVMPYVDLSSYAKKKQEFPSLLHKGRCM